ncbi:PEP-CTERM/exosortase system-associated acyltransferase [Onishia niordana]|uniref:PEP-CTERM/exosortase system-associated acyltransferase n=1 Tax=Onishia niordana TaxID=2508711 RepID=UPI001F0D26A7|nr:PEP-CTERM/exosortase system-associated acyltransferase [Halomonas niordiana]
MENKKITVDLYEEFYRHFSFEIAKTKKERMRAYAIRHQVYREEMKCDIGDKEKPYEYDEYDKNSTLCIVIHKMTGTPVGCLRLVSPDNTPLSPCYILPLEKNCKGSLTHPRLRPECFKKSEICEISRLAVPKEFRKKTKTPTTKEVFKKETEEINNEHGHLFPVIGISLFLASTAIAGITGRRHVFAMMEKRFSRLLGMSGIRFQAAGSSIHYHGERSPFYIDQQEAERSMKPQLKRLYTSIKEDLENQYYLQEKIEIESPHDVTTY